MTCFVTITGFPGDIFAKTLYSIRIFYQFNYSNHQSTEGNATNAPAGFGHMIGNKDRRECLD